MLIDTHTHLDFEVYKQDRDEIIAECIKNDIKIINIGTHYQSSKMSIALAKKYPEQIYPTIGLHPIHCLPSQPNYEKFDFEKYKKIALSNKLIAIGEIGLDYSYAKKEWEKELQKEVFQAQIVLAQELKLPIIIHCREGNSIKDSAFNDVIEILKRFNFVKNNKLNGVVHFFSGNLEQVDQLFELGFIVSFTGVITFNSNYHEVIKNISMEKILLETDCPFVAPVPYRGQRNTPLYVKYVAEKIAEIKNLSFKQVAEITTLNAKRLFLEK